MSKFNKSRIWQWMREQLIYNSEDFIDPTTGEPQYTKLAEECALSLGHAEWLDDPDHMVWDEAVEAFDFGVE
jgi:hypothetical protein